MTDMPGTSHESEKWTSSEWLRILFYVTGVLCALQIAAGMAAHSLALIGDSVHAVLDVFSYGVAIIIERMKENRVGNRRHVAIIDLMACLISIGIVCYASYVVSEEAVARLYLPGGHTFATDETATGAHAIPLVDQVGKEETAAQEATGYANVLKSIIRTETDKPAGTITHGKLVTVDGRLMFLFAVMSTICNGWLAWVGFKTFFSGGGKIGWLDWLHNLVHAGHHENCSHDHGSTSHDHVHENSHEHHGHGHAHGHGAAHGDAHRCGHQGHGSCDGEAIRPKEETDTVNLNLCMQWLHVLTDALRGIVLFVASLCIMTEWVKPTAADAGVALVVVFMVGLGSLSLIPLAYRRTQDIIYGDHTLDELDALLPRSKSKTPS